MRKRLAIALGTMLLAISVTGVAAASANALPVIYNFEAGVAASLLNPGGSPPGANDWDCQPSAEHPRPVVLTHGTAENMMNNWHALAPLLKNNGYCVFAFNFGETSYSAGQFYGLGDTAQSAELLRDFVDRVLLETGASKVDIVGHSQGGIMPRYYLKFLGGAGKVRRLVGLAPTNHGTTYSGLQTITEAVPGLADVSIFLICPTCRDRLIGSEFNQNLDAGGDTLPGISYTVVATKYDEIATPYTNGFLSGPDVTNITLQNGCFWNFSEHLAISYDRRALTHVLNALDPGNPRSVPCVPTVPFVGG